MLGPIDYTVVGFSGNNFDGSILDALGAAVDKDIIRVIDLLFIMKDSQGEILEGEYEDQSDDIQEMIAKTRYLIDDGLPLITEADIAKIGEQMPPDTAAAVLVIEHIWAKDLKKALMDANGILIADGRIHPEAVEDAVKELEAAKA
jgi:hypothetical protein